MSTDSDPVENTSEKLAASYRKPSFSWSLLLLFLSGISFEWTDAWYWRHEFSYFLMFACPVAALVKMYWCRVQCGPPYWNRRLRRGYLGAFVGIGVALLAIPIFGLIVWRRDDPMRELTTGICRIALSFLIGAPLGALGGAYVSPWCVRMWKRCRSYPAGHCQTCGLRPFWECQRPVSRMRHGHPNIRKAASGLNHPR